MITTKSEVISTNVFADRQFNRIYKVKYIAYLFIFNSYLFFNSSELKLSDVIGLHRVEILT